MADARPTPDRPCSLQQLQIASAQPASGSCIAHVLLPCASSACNASSCALDWASTTAILLAGVDAGAGEGVLLAAAAELLEAAVPSPDDPACCKDSGCSAPCAAGLLWLVRSSAAECVVPLLGLDPPFCCLPPICLPARGLAPAADAVPFASGSFGCAADVPSAVGRACFSFFAFWLATALPAPVSQWKSRAAQQHDDGQSRVFGSRYRCQGLGFMESMGFM